MRFTVEQHIVRDAVNGDLLFAHIQLTAAVSIDLEDGLCRESKGIFERCSAFQPNASLPLYTPPLGLAVKG